VETGQDPPEAGSVTRDPQPDDKNRAGALQTRAYPWASLFLGVPFEAPICGVRRGNIATTSLVMKSVCLECPYSTLLDIYKTPTGGSPRRVPRHARKNALNSCSIVFTLYSEPSGAFLGAREVLQRAVIVEGGGLFTGRFRPQNLNFLVPSSGPWIPPAVSGSFCCAFRQNFHPRSSVLDRFRNTFSCPDFALLDPLSEAVKSPL
jgi:hypothetical protein